MVSNQLYFFNNWKTKISEKLALSKATSLLTEEEKESSPRVQEGASFLTRTAHNSVWEGTYLLKDCSYFNLCLKNKISLPFLGIYIYIYLKCMNTSYINKKKGVKPKIF